jgi:hypothetical protein
LYSVVFIGCTHTHTLSLSPFSLPPQPAFTEREIYVKLKINKKRKRCRGMIVSGNESAKAMIYTQKFDHHVQQ